MTTLNSCNPLRPDTTNICTNEEIPNVPTKVVPNSCTCFGFKHSKRFAKGICGDLGDSEWKLAGKHKHFPKCISPDDRYTNGCGNCEFGVKLSKSVVCERITYNGDPTICCLRDYDFDNINKFCFQDATKKKTCPPSKRNITTSVCQLEISNYCLGSELPATSTEWFDRWTKPSTDTKNIPPCIYALNRNLFGNPYVPTVVSGTPPGAEFFLDIRGLEWSQSLLREAFIKYREQGFEVGASPGFPGYDDFQNVLYTICKTVPGLCGGSLSDICHNVNTEELTINPALISWCGCYMPNEQYKQYVDDFGITKECTPTCSQLSAIKLSTPSQVGVLQCKQNICIMDDITIALAESQIEGNINFVQLCGNCSGESSCQCVISDVSLSVINSAIGGDVDITQICGQTTCVRTNPETGKPRTLPIDCDNPADDPFEQFNNDKVSAAEFENTIITLTIVLGFIVFIVVIVILAVFY